jgi:hypothetical protein
VVGFQPQIIGSGYRIRSQLDATGGFMSRSIIPCGLGPSSMLKAASFRCVTAPVLSGGSQLLLMWREDSNLRTLIRCSTHPRSICINLRPSSVTTTVQPPVRSLTLHMTGVKDPTATLAILCIRFSDGCPHCGGWSVILVFPKRHRFPHYW